MSVADVMCIDRLRLYACVNVFMYVHRRVSMRVRVDMHTPINTHTHTHTSAYDPHACIIEPTCLQIARASQQHRHILLNHLTVPTLAPGPARCGRTVAEELLASLVICSCANNHAIVVLRLVLSVDKFTHACVHIVRRLLPLTTEHGVS